MDFIVVLLDELEAEGLVPALREHIEGDLTSNRELQVQFGELFFQLSDKCFTHIGRLIILLELVALSLRAVAANRANIHHAIAELDECATIERR